MSIERLYKLYPVLKEINKDTNGLITEKAIFRNIGIGEYLSNDNESCVGILFVISGVINIQKINNDGDETNLYNINEGELCHEAFSCFLSCESLNIVGRAMENSEVCIIPMGISKKYLIENNKFLNYIYKDLYKKFKGVIRNKEEFIHEPLEVRLIKLLMNKGTKIIYTTHSELAYELGSAREVVSRKLKQLEAKGYIKLKRGKINILKNLQQ